MTASSPLFRAAEGLADDAAEARTTDLGWGGHTCAPVEVTIVPGDHITMLARENLPVLAERLDACLEKRASRETRGRAPTAKAGAVPPAGS